MIQNLILTSIAVAGIVTASIAADTATTNTAAAKIPGIDFTKPGPSPSPSPLPPPLASKRKKSTTTPAFGVGASGNNDGYLNGAGKVRVGF
jgi:hypothetical protein